MDGPSVRNPFFQTPKMSRFLYENHRGGPTLTLLNVLGVLGVLNVLNVLYELNVLHVLHVLNMLNMLMDTSLACWALFLCSRAKARKTSVLLHLMSQLSKCP